jgi:hypothetical protein
MATLITDKGAPYIEDIWLLEDFRGIADDYPKEEFTDEELLQAMEIVADNFDANYGINWQTIEAALDRIAWERRLTKWKQEKNDE